MDSFDIVVEAICQAGMRQRRLLIAADQVVWLILAVLWVQQTHQDQLYGYLLSHRHYRCY
jgi:hypothetical protein